MNSKELLEQANLRVVQMNKLMGEIEDFEGVIGAAQESDSEIAFHERGIGTTFIKVLSPEKMSELKEAVIVAIIHARNEKTSELERLINPVPRKSAIINPEFEAAVKEMEQSTKKQPDPVEQKLSDIIQKQEQEIAKPKLTDADLADVKRMYCDEGKTQGYLADYYGVKKGVINAFLQKHKLFRTTYKKDDVFLDAQVEALRKTSGREQA